MTEEQEEEVLNYRGVDGSGPQTPDPTISEELPVLATYSKGTR